MRRIALWVVIAFVLTAFWYQTFHGEHHNLTTPDPTPVTCEGGTLVHHFEGIGESSWWECER